jgi:hypothetical protein
MCPKTPAIVITRGVRSRESATPWGVFGETFTRRGLLQIYRSTCTEASGQRLRHRCRDCMSTAEALNYSASSGASGSSFAMRDDAR